jgi:UDP-sulfoquinovose synthase
LAVENPAEQGEFRVFNQFAESYSIQELAYLVQEVSAEFGLKVEVKHYENPRGEKEEHYYNPIREGLDKLGYQPTTDVKSEVRLLIQDLLEHKERIAEKADVLVPHTRWDGNHHRSAELSQAASVR